MEFWIFMMIVTLLMPLSMVIIGAYFRKRSPKRINYFYGYRTTMSMKNKDTWEFAHHYFGNLWVKWGLITLIITFIAMLVVLGKDDSTVGILVVILIIIQSVPMIGAIIATERALREHFDKDGNRKM